MIRLRSFLPFVLALAPLASGCKKDEPTQAQPENALSAPMISSAKVKLPMRGPMAPMAKIDPQAMKEYRLESCWFGTLTLRQARDAYLASLGKDEPSEKKIPSFGTPGAAPPGAPPRPGSTPAAAPAPSAAAGPAPSAAAGPAPSAAAGRRIVDMGLRAPHERNARACTVASTLKEPAMGDVDAALATFAPFAFELSRKISEASVYYQREEYKKDKFEKGKELHKKLVADFAKLDELSDKLGAAINAFRKDHPPDAGKQDEGEKLVVAAYDKAREILLSVLPKKIDTAAYKTNVAALEAAIGALKTFGSSHADDSWAKITAPSFDATLKAAKDAEAKISDKGLEPDVFLSMVNTFSSLIEARNRALSRALIAKGQVIEPHGGGLPVRPAIPRPNGGPPNGEPPKDPHGDHQH